MSVATPARWDRRAIRQAARVLGAQSSWVGDVQSTARAQRLMRDMLDRRGIATELSHVPQTMPLVVAGDGPILIVTYLDDSNPSAQDHDGSPPRLDGDAVISPGIIRKAGVLAASGPMFAGSRDNGRYTLAIEADRHAGSLALEAWLERSGRRFDCAFWEASDLPTPAPALYRATHGRLTIRISVPSAGGGAEAMYANALPDAGHILATILASMKTMDAEIALPRFYDDVLSPTADDLSQMDSIADRLSAWIDRVTPAATGAYDPRHRMRAVLFAPALVVRSIGLPDMYPFVNASATAIVDLRLIPGQRVDDVLRSTIEHARRHSPDVSVEALLVRPPAEATLAADVNARVGVPMLPIAPGDSPAGILEIRGIPTLGFATVNREIAASMEQVNLGAIEAGTKMLEQLAEGARGGSLNRA